MTNDLERVTKLAEECGAETTQEPSYIWFRPCDILITRERLLAYTQKVEQAVLAKQADVIATHELGFKNLATALATALKEIESLQAKLAMQAEALLIANDYMPTEPARAAKTQGDIACVNNAIESTQADVDNWMQGKKAECEKGVLEECMKRLHSDVGRIPRT